MLLRSALAAAASSTTNSLPALEIAAVFDFAGLTIAIWTLWSCIELPAGGALRRAFWLISLGSVAFAFSHVLDTILQLLDIDAATLVHQGAIIVSILFFLPGLASLTDVLPIFRRRKTEPVPPLRLWPFAVALTLVISAGSFILYGVGALAETVAFFALDGSLLLLAGISLIFIVRAQLGGTIGHSLWLALLGLLLFSLAHPVQVWFYATTNYPSDLLGAVHRLIVMPAFFLFAFSITRVVRSLARSFAA